MIDTILRYAAAPSKSALAPDPRMPSYDRIVRLKTERDASVRRSSDVHVEGDVIGNGVRIAELALQSIARE